MIKLVSLFCVLLLVQSALSADYVVTTKFMDNSPGNIAFSPITYGSGDVLSISFQFSVTSNKACVLSLGKDKGLLQVTVKGGRLTFTDHKTSISSSQSISSNRYYHVVFELKNNAAGTESTATFYLNGVDRSNTLSSRKMSAFVNAQRKESFVGICPAERSAEGGYVYFDEFRIYDRALTQTEISEAANPEIHVPPSFIGLVVYFPFNEGTGKVSYGLASSTSSESYVATLNKFAAFTTRNNQGVLKCQSTGDPHVTSFKGTYWTPKHVTAHAKLVGCNHGGVNDFFAIYAFHDFGHPSYPKATLNREAKIVYGNHALKISRTQDVYGSVGGGPFQKLSSGQTTFGPFHLERTSNRLKVFATPYGIFQINFNNAATHMDLYVTISSTMCSVRSKSYCDDSKDFIEEIEYETGSPVPLSPPLAEPPHEDYHPCDEDEKLADLAHTVCSAKFQVNSPKYKACVFDVCATGDPGIIEDPNEDCIAEKRRLILEGRQEEADKLDCEDCHCISGVCETDPITGSKYCKCFDGYAGPDCSQEAFLLNMTLEHKNLINGRAVHLNPHMILVPPHQVQAQTVRQLNDWIVEDTLALYVGAVRDVVGSEIRYKYYLFVVGDLSYKSQPVPFTFTFNSNVNPTVQFLRPGAHTHNGNQATIVFSNFDEDGMVLSDLGDDFCVSFDFTGHPFRQIAIGSGTRLGKLDVLKMRSETDDFLKICGKRIVNPCAQYDRCDTCMANDACGWCRSSSKCLFGNAAGPTEGSSCAVWSYTYEEDISRRINADFGAPVNPKKQEVFLVKGGSALSKLPAEITIDMGAVRSSYWDFAIISPTTVPDILEFSNHINDYLKGLRSFGDVGVSFYLYDQDTTKQVSIFQSIDRATETFRDLIVRSAQTSKKDGNPTRAIRNALRDFRTHSRRVVAIVVSAADSTPTELDATRDALLMHAVFPVFIVRRTHTTKFENFVRDLGFGHVITIDDGGKQLGAAIKSSLEYASKITSMVPVEEGYIVGSNQEVWNVFGLTTGMRARMIVPLERNDNEAQNLVSTLVAPGFGKATIENLLNDKPTGDTFDVFITQDQRLVEQEGKPNPLPGVVIQFAGRALNPSDPVFLQIVDLGTPFQGDSVGKFYQYPDDLKAVDSYDELEELVVGTGSGFIKDPAGRVIYVPPENVFSVSNKIGQNIFTSVRYVVYDSCTASNPEHAHIYIVYENNRPPEAHVSSPLAVENQVALITLEGEDFREHELKMIVSRVPYHVVDEEEVTVGRLYQFNQAAFNTLSAANDIYRDISNLKDILDGLTVVNDGDEVTDPNGRLIFVPDIYTNSEWKPASGKYQVDPRMSFYVEQIRNEHDDKDDKMLTSSVLTFDYQVKWVNQPPSVTQYTAPHDPERCSFETSRCCYPQNFGLQLPDVPSLEFFPAIVTDIEEEENLMIKLVDIQCGKSYFIDKTNQRVEVGRLLDGFAHDTWTTAFQFIPDTNEYGIPFCNFTYVGFDGELESLDSATIVIDIYHINQRPYSNEQLIRAYTNTPDEVDVEIFDPDSEVVELTVKRCDAGEYDYDFRMYVNDIEIDCQSLPTTIGNITKQDGALKYNVRLEVEDTGLTLGHVVDLVVTYNDFEDRDEELREFKINAYYINVNNPPVVWKDPFSHLNSTDYSEVIEDAITFRPNDPGLLPIPLKWFDADAKPDGITKIIVNVTPADAGLSFLFIHPNISDLLHFFDSDGFNARIEGYSQPLMELFEYFYFYAYDAGHFNVSFEVHDNGNFGSCTVGNPNACDKVGYAKFSVRTRDGQYIGPAAAGGAAAGAVLVGVAAAAFAWYKVKRLRAPVEGNDPWLLDDQQEGVVDNPMYEQRGMEGENPIFEAPE